MKIVTSIATVVVHLLLSVLGEKILEEANFCRRNDPQIRKCFCENFNKWLPIIKKGVPEMNIMPIDPVQVEHIRMEWPQTRAVQFRGELSNVTLHGMSLGRAVQCNIYITKNGVQIAVELHFPEIEMKARYNGSGKYMMFVLHGNGDYWGKYTGVNVRSIWNSTHFIKHGKEHLKFTANVTYLKIEKIQINFANLLGNSTEINDKINEMLNENIDILYDEVKPIIMQTIEKMCLTIINNLYDQLPFDVLFPKN